MATKRFDDVAEKARALEAQAKKLRREAQAARTKAYADALVTVFPEVKDMGSAEEVLDFVKGLKPGTGHGTPDARAPALRIPVMFLPQKLESRRKRTAVFRRGLPRVAVPGSTEGFGFHVGQGKSFPCPTWTGEARWTKGGGSKGTAQPPPRKLTE